MDGILKDQLLQLRGLAGTGLTLKGPIRSADLIFKVPRWQDHTALPIIQYQPYNFTHFNGPNLWVFVQGNQPALLKVAISRRSLPDEEKLLQSVRLDSGVLLHKNKHF